MRWLPCSVFMQYLFLGDPAGLPPSLIWPSPSGAPSQRSLLLCPLWSSLAALYVLSGCLGEELNRYSPRRCMSTRLWVGNRAEAWWHRIVLYFLLASRVVAAALPSVSTSIHRSSISAPVRLPGLRRWRNC